MAEPDDLEFIEEDDATLEPSEVERFKTAVLYSTDWTVETILTQLERGNIDLNPRFQRRDAWGLNRKSQFIESIVLGFPIPQIVLAEKRDKRGSFIVLDGKQRLLTLLQFTGNADESDTNKFSLRGLEARRELRGKTYAQIEQEAKFSSDLTAFQNHTIRTVVIRNWPTTTFLHLVFLRLNTGSLKLSPQELRQAMVPGPFSDFVDDEAVGSKELQRLLSRNDPDPRMRDVELLVRFLAFANYITSYNGRMKKFLDEACLKMNASWKQRKSKVKTQVSQFNSAIGTLIDIFGQEGIARKEGSRSFNRAIFDALVFYAANPKVRTAMKNNKARVTKAYNATLRNEEFSEAVESDTAGIPHTLARLRIWGTALGEATRVDFPVPRMKNKRISLDGA